MAEKARKTALQIGSSAPSSAKQTIYQPMAWYLESFSGRRSGVDAAAVVIVVQERLLG